jgi:hypothetical protein
MRRCPGGTHHADAAGLDGRVLADAIPNLKVFFGGLPIRRRSGR